MVLLNTKQMEIIGDMNDLYLLLKHFTILIVTAKTDRYYSRG